jgi:hypothetical protein
MRFARLRIAAATALLMTIAADSALPQSATPKAGSSRQQTTNGEGQKKKIDEFVEAATVLGGPASSPECVWLGRRVVGLISRDDLDTAFRHLDLYDRFGCPAGHIQAAFRCLVQQGNIDLKTPDTLASRVHACWIDPTHKARAAASSGPSSAAAASSGTTNR